MTSVLAQYCCDVRTGGEESGLAVFIASCATWIGREEVLISLSYVLSLGVVFRLVFFFKYAFSPQQHTIVNQNL